MQQSPSSSAPRVWAAFFVGALLASGANGASASEETVDQMTQSALRMDAHPAKGGPQFRQYCARCHGAKAHGNASRAIPSLAGQRFAYLVRQLANLSGDQRESKVMHSVLSTPILRDPQTWVDIAAYLNGAPALHRAETGDGSKLKLGGMIFREQCASCHRDDARGDDDGFVPSLRNQLYSYLLIQIDGLANGDRHNVDENLARFLRSFDADEVRAVADYLSRLQGPAHDRATMRGNGVVVD